jgi:hypothetical protein
MRHSVVLSAAFAAVSLAARVLAQDAAPPSANSNTAPVGDAVAAAESTPPEPPADASAETAEAAPRPLPPAGEYVLAERPEALRGLARVAITSFALEYMTFLEAKTEGNWGNLIGNKPNDVSVKMVGQDTSGWQPVADAFGAHVLKVRLTVLPTQVSADHSFWVGGHVTTRASRSRETSSATPPRASWSTPLPPPRRPAKSPASASASSARSPASPHPAPSANPRTTNFASTTPPTRRPSQKS